MKTQDDENLVQRCRSGDREAFGELLDRYEKRIFNVAWRLVYNTEDARDITQTVFTNVFTSLDRFDPRYRFFGWIYRITVNESIKLLKRRRHVDELDDSVPSLSKNAGEVLYASELSRAIRKCLMQLSPDYRVVIILRHFAECSYRDMSQILDIPEKTVKSRLFSARRQMRDALTECGAIESLARNEPRRRRSDSA